MFIDHSKKTVIIFSCLFAVLMISSCSKNNSTYSGISKEELVEKINELTIKESDDLDSEKLIEACTALSKRAQDFTDEELLAVIKDDKMTSITKSTLIQLETDINHGKGIIDQGPFEELITQKSLEDDVRINLIQTLDMSSDENKDILEKIVKSEDGAIVIRSLITLQKDDPKKALSIANQIINSYSTYGEDAIRAAVMVKSNYFRDLKLAGSQKNVSAEKKNYINFCIRKFNASQDDVFKDAMVFSLIDMLDFDAVKEIINHKNIDHLLKTTCISRNYLTFAEVINNNPSEEDIELLLTAMEMAPIRDLVGLMREKLAANATYQSDRLNNVLTIMETQGIPADRKRLERTPNPAWIE